jgi:hypothetical protein
VRIEDVVEIPIELRFRYAQLTHADPGEGFCLRVFERVLDEPASEFAWLAGEPVAVALFTSLESAVNEGFARIVDNRPVRANLRPCPTFRTKNGMVWSDAGVRESGDGDPDLGQLPLLEYVWPERLTERLMTLGEQDAPP